MRTVSQPASAGNTHPFALFLAALCAASTQPTEPPTNIPGLISGPTRGFCGGTLEEIWTAGEHAERRLREAREGQRPGTVTSNTVERTTDLWFGPRAETVVLTVIRYPASAKIPPPSRGGAVRGAIAREIVEVGA